MPTQKLEKLQELLKLTNSNITREEFLAAFKKVMTEMLKLKQDLVNSINFKESEERKKLERLAKSFEKTFAEMEKTIIALNKKVDEKLASVKDGKDADEDKVVDKVMNKIRQPKDGADADESKIVGQVLKIIPDYGKKLEALEKEMREELQTLKQNRRFGGGTSAIGIANAAKYFVKTEEPVGDIDGVNTDYTVSKPIMAVLAFHINGEVIAQLPNYTISNKTVSFTTALPAAYSGKDFEIVYI